MNNKLRLRARLINIAVAVLSIAVISPAWGMRAPADVDARKVTSAPDSTHTGKIGLVLSGGGAKGIAHVGVIKALEENNIPIDYVTGTSMGAIVGSLYSCGYSPEKMMELFTSRGFHYWSTGTIPEDEIYYYMQPTPTPKWVSLNLNFKDTTSLSNQILPTSLISPIPMNIEFLCLYSPYTEQCGGNFDNLFVPFRCVTSDVFHKHKIVCSKGSLGDAVRASMSFPMVFKPIEMDGVLVYDGGIYDNFPVDVMREDFDPGFIIGVSVSSPDQKPNPNDIYSQVEDMIIQNNNYNLPAKEGVKIQVPVLDFGVLDFGQAKTIYEIGYKTGLAMVDSIKKRTPLRRTAEEVASRRATFNGKTPVVEFDSVVVTGARPNQNRFIEAMFKNRHNRKSIGLEEVKNSYYREVTDGTLTDLLPQARFGEDGDNTLLLKASVKNPWRVGAGGWISSSTNSMLYLSFGYHTLSFNSLDTDLGLWIGQSYYAASLSGRFAIRDDVPSYVQMEAVVSRQKFYDTELLFYQTSSPSFITDFEAFIRATYCLALGKKSKAYASLAYGWIDDRYFPYNSGQFTGDRKDKSSYRMAILKAGVENNTLNDQMYPDAGRQLMATLWIGNESNRFIPGQGDGGSDRYYGHWLGSVELKWKQFFPLHRRFKIGVATDLLATLQPLYQNYTATQVHGAAFAPTPSTRNYFNPAFRSNNYVAAGVMPVWSPIGKLQLRGDFYVYAPMRQIMDNGNANASYGKWFRRADFIGEVALVYNFPFASLSVYGNYLSYPARNWNFGINLGLLYQAPKLFR